MESSGCKIRDTFGRQTKCLNINSSGFEEQMTVVNTEVTQYLLQGCLVFVKFLFRLRLSVGFSYMVLIMLRHIHSIYSSFYSSTNEGMMDFIKGFLCFYWDDHVIFVFKSIYVCVGFSLHLLLVEPCMHCQNKTSLVTVDKLCMSVIYLQVFYLGNFKCMIISDIHL